MKKHILNLIRVNSKQKFGMIKETKLLNFIILISLSILTGCINNPLGGSSSNSKLGLNFRPGLSSNPVAYLFFYSNPSALYTGYCDGPYSVMSLDSSYVQTVLSSDLIVTTSSSPSTGPVFYSDSNCSTSASTFTIPSGSSSVSFYIRSRIAGSYTVSGTSAGLPSTSFVLQYSRKEYRVDLLFGKRDTTGELDGVGTAAQFRNGNYLETDGTNIFISDYGGNLIKKYDPVTQNVTTYAGASGLGGGVNGALNVSTFSNPTGMAYDSSTQILYVVEYGNCAIRAVNTSTSTVSKVAGSTCGASVDHATGTSAVLYRPMGGVILGTYLYFVEYNSALLRRMSLTAPYGITTVAGSTAGFQDGTLLTSKFYRPTGVETDGTYLYVSDWGNNRIRKVDIAGDSVTTIAGSASAGGTDHATGTSATFSAPHSLKYYAPHNALYVSDRNSFKIRKVSLNAPYAVTTVAGSGSSSNTDGNGTSATIGFPKGMTILGSTLYVSTDYLNLRTYNLVSGDVTTIAGQTNNFGYTATTWTDAKFNNIQGVVQIGTALYVSDEQNHVIRKLDLVTGDTSVFAGTQGTGSFLDGTGTAARLRNPKGLCYDGTNIYIADSGNHTIRVLNPSTAAVSSLAGGQSNTNYGAVDATGSVARFNTPWGVTCLGPSVYVSEYATHTIRQIDKSTGAVTTLAGTSGTSGYTDATGTSAKFSFMNHITNDGTYLYVSENSNRRIRKITTAGVVTTLAGSGASGFLDGNSATAKFTNMYGITYDNGYLYTIDYDVGSVRKINATTGDVTTVLGNVLARYESDGVLSSASGGMAWVVYANSSGIYVGTTSGLRWIH